MSIVDTILNNKEKIQYFLDELNCDNDRWFVFNEKTLENPILRSFSSKMSKYILKRNTTIKHRFLYLKYVEDMIMEHQLYPRSNYNTIDLENEKYKKIKNGYLRSDIIEDKKLSGLFANEKIYGISYYESWGGVDTHIDPWFYSKPYKNILFLTDIKNFKLFINNKEIEVKENEPLLTDFRNCPHKFISTKKDSKFRVLHIDYEDI